MAINPANYYSVREGLILRPLRTDDLPGLNTALLTPEILAYMLGAGNQSIRDTFCFYRQNIGSALYPCWAIMTEDGQGMAGMVEGYPTWRALHFDYMGNTDSIGVWLLPDWRGKGVGARATLIMAEYLFATRPTSCWLQASCSLNNEVSAAMLRKAGFEDLEKIRWYGGQPERCFALSREAFTGPQPERMPVKAGRPRPSRRRPDGCVL